MSDRFWRKADSGRDLATKQFALPQPSRCAAFRAPQRHLVRSCYAPSLLLAIRTSFRPFRPCARN